MKSQVRILAMVLLMGISAAGSTYKVLYSFTGGSDGGFPADFGSLALDTQGNLYVTTNVGGTCGEGTLFELSPNGNGGWTPTVVHSFCGADGAYPSAAPSWGAGQEGPFATTPFGGANGCGSLYYFHENYHIDFDCGDLYGAYPQASALVYPLSDFDVAGTSPAGGVNGHGIVWTGTNGSSYSFCSRLNCIDGDTPVGGLAVDSQYNLYGTTELGGGAGQGVVYQLVPFVEGDIWGFTENVLHDFSGGSNDGAYPGSTLTLATSTGSGNIMIYGTTTFGGIPCPYFAPGCGTVFQISPANGNAFSLLHVFGGGVDGCQSGCGPSAGVTMLNGMLYGTAQLGGLVRVGRHTRLGSGVVYSLTLDGNYNVLYTFSGGSDGADPLSGLVADSNGNLYGVTLAGGAYDAGVVFEITP